MKPKEEKQYIKIIEYATGNTVDKIEVTGKSERQIDKVDSGINRNLDYEKYYTVCP